LLHTTVFLWLESEGRSSLLRCKHRRRDKGYEENAMSDRLDPLILDLIEWVAREPRTYADVMEAWRTSCPRLTVWEDAVDRGFVARERADGASLEVVVTPAGRQFLADNGRHAEPNQAERHAMPHLSKAASIGTR
jgi:hypothetical protein